VAGGRALAVLGGLAALLVGAGLWLVLATDEDPADAGADAVRDAAAAAGVSAGADRQGARRRSTAGGTAALSGVVRFRDGERPAAAQAVELLREGCDAWTAETDAAGAFALTSLPDGGPYELRVAAAGFATVRLPGIGLGRGERRDAGTLWLDRAVRLAVHVRDFADRPIAGAEVRAFVAPDYGDDFDWSKAFAQMALAPVAVARAGTDVAGTAVFAEMASGDWTFVASAPGRANGAARQVELRGGQEPPDVVIRLGAGHELRGRVLDPDGKPVAGAAVLAGAPQDAWDVGASAARLRAVADAEGRWSLAGLAAGDVALSAGRPGTVPAPRAVVHVPSVGSFDLVLRPTGAVVGTVTQKETGAPVEGATVRATQWGRWSPQVAEATTDAAGRYRIDAFPAGGLNELRAEREGLVFVGADEGWMQTRDRLVVAGGELHQDLVLQRGASVAGRVTSADGPVDGAKVVLRVVASQGGVEWSGTTTTAADGTWRLDGVLPGAAYGEARKDGWWQRGLPAQWWDLPADGAQGAELRVAVPESGEVRLDLVLERAPTLRGRVEGPDGPVAGAQVTAAEVSGFTAADGSFALAGVRPAPGVAVCAAKDGFVPRTQAVPVPEEGAPPEVVLRLARPGVVRGRVTSTDGSPLRDARVHVVLHSDEVAFTPWGIDEMAGTGAPFPVAPDGTYVAAVLHAEGKFVVRASSADHGTGTSPPVAIEEGRSEYVADIALTAAGRVRGRVVAAGAAVGGAQVALTPSAEGPSVTYESADAAPTVWAVTDAQGAFDAGPVPAGRWGVGARAPDHVEARRDGVVVPSAEEVVLEMTPALGIEGQVVLEDGTPVPGAEVAARPEHGIESFDGKFAEEDEEQGGPTRTDPAGRFRLRGLAAGSYRVHVEPAWGSRVNVRPTTSEPIVAGTAGVKVVVPPGGTIAGRVVDLEDRPFGHRAWIGAHQEDEDGGLGEFRQSAPRGDGSFELNGLDPAAKWTVSVRVQGGAVQPGAREHVAVGTRDLVFRLAPALTIEGTVVDGEGRPVAGVHVQASPVAAARVSMSFGGEMRPSGADGAFVVAGLAPGRFRLSAANWGGEATKRVRLLGVEDVAAGTKGLRVVASDGGRVAGTVRDAQGRPVAGAHVQVVGPGEWIPPVATGDDGRFEVAALPDTGTVKVSVTAAGHACGGASDVPVGTADVRIALGRAVATSGRALDAAGRPLRRVRLQFQPEAREGEGAVPVDISRETDDEGRFTCDQLAEGRWTATVWRKEAGSSGSWTTEELGAFAAGAEGVELRLR
jgi:protocatechuate 3,4-dioxygenase beta subunit